MGSVPYQLYLLSWAARRENVASAYTCTISQRPEEAGGVSIRTDTAVPESHEAPRIATCVQIMHPLTVCKGQDAAHDIERSGLVWHEGSAVERLKGMEWQQRRGWKVPHGIIKRRDLYGTFYGSLHHTRKERFRWMFQSSCSSVYVGDTTTHIL